MVSTPAVMQNFLDVSQEMERRDLTKGGTVNQNLKLSSSTAVAGVATFNGPVIFNSSVTISGGLFGTLYASSATTIPVAISTNSTAWLGACHVHVASLTITSNGNNVEIWLNATLNNSGASQITRIHVLDNGDFFNGQTATRPIAQFTQSNGAGTTVNPGWSYLIQPKPAAGSHTYCLGLSVDGGIGTLNCATHVCQFGVREVP